jgi:predicted nucleic acid-binding protein
MRSTEVCVDASVAIKVVVPEAGSDLADALFDQVGHRGDTTDRSRVL